MPTRQGSVIYSYPGQVICFEKRREYFPVGSTPASLPARLSNQTTCPSNQSFTCLDDVVLASPQLPISLNHFFCFDH